MRPPLGWCPWAQQYSLIVHEKTTWQDLGTWKTLETSARRGTGLGVSGTKPALPLSVTLFQGAWVKREKLF